MREPNRILAIAAIIAVAAAAPTTLYAENSHESSGSLMGALP